MERSHLSRPLRSRNLLKESMNPKESRDMPKPYVSRDLFEPPLFGRDSFSIVQSVFSVLTQ
jgi:hypothetical protein